MFVIGVFVLMVGWLMLLLKLCMMGWWCGVLLWGVGVFVVWGFVYMLLLLWFDVVKSYCLVFDDLNVYLVFEWNDGDCMVSLFGFGELEVLMMYYFFGI